MKASDANPEPSVSPQEVIYLFKAALEQPGWIEDKFPRAGSKVGSEIPPSGLDDGVKPNH